MLKTSEWFRPKPGEIVFCKLTGVRKGVVTHVTKNICHYLMDNGKETSYIWRFVKYVHPFTFTAQKLDCLNKLHYTWPDSEYRDPQIGDCYA
ncbi:hypothetical protein VPHD148_0297 [Vibrio phage D148]